MGIPVVIKAAGGLPVTVATSGYGVPMEIATNGYGIAITQVAAGGLPVVGVTFGPSIVLSNYSVAENSAVNTVVGTLSMSGTTGTPTYTLTGTAGGRFKIVGNSLQVAAATIDYETATSHGITVSVSGVTPVVSATNFTIAVLNVTVIAPLAPVLVLTSALSDTTPDFTLTGDLAVNDTVRFQYSTAADFTGASELTNTIDASEDTANSITFTTGTLAVTTWYFRARIERPEAPNGDWSNVVTATLSGVAYDAATTLWINAVVAGGGTVSDTQKGRVDTLIIGLKADGLFSTSSRLWLHAGESVAKQATIDIMGLVTGTLTAAPTLGASGYTGNGTTQYISYGALPANFVMDGGSYAAYNLRNSTSTNNECLMGAFSGAGLSDQIAGACSSPRAVPRPIMRLT